jgi:hypothetical protein
METERVGHLPFLDTTYLQKAQQLSGLQSICKPTHTILYLNAGSHHQSSNKQAALSTLMHRARAICDEDNLHVKLVFLRGIFRQNSYKDRQIHNVLNRRPNISKPNNRPSSVAFLPNAGPIFSQISRVLAQHNIKSVGMPHKKISSFLQPVLDK